jgi:hypothetical protein
LGNTVAHIRHTTESIIMSFLKIWFAATALIVTGFFMWAYVPILIPLLALAGGLGALTFGIVALARFAERWVEGRRINERRINKPRDDG